MKKDFKVYIDDILESMKKIQNYVTGLKYTDFVENDLVIDAVVRNLEIIGEASKYISEDIRTETYQKSSYYWKEF